MLSHSHGELIHTLVLVGDGQWNVNKKPTPIFVLVE
jgi:hypothetical protein